MSRVGLFVGLALVLVVAGCGGDDDSDGGGGNGGSDAAQATNTPSGNSGGETPEATATDSEGGNDADFHACSLFTGAEMSEAIGAQVADGRDYLATAAKATNCVWEGDVVIYIEVLLEDGPSWYDAIHIVDAEDDVEEVEGLGDEALWNEFLGTLDVIEGDRFISIQPLVGFSELDSKEVALELAPLTLERLP